MTQEALIWMISVHTLVAIATAYLFCRVFSKEGKQEH